MNGIEIILCASAVLLLRVGLVLYGSGLSRSKNAASIVVRHVCDVALASLAYWALGAAIAEASGNGVFSIDFGRFLDWNAQGSAATVVLALGATLASGIAIGPAIERSRFWVSPWIALLIGAILMPLAMQWTNSGWLSRIGFTDGAGGASIQMVGGLAGLVVALFVGPRNGKYNRDGSANFIPGHNTPIAMTGLLIMFAMWIPYVAVFAGMSGVVMEKCALNVLISAAAATVAALVTSQLRYGKPDAMLICSALIGGLVAITPGAMAISSQGALLIGAGAGVLVPTAIVSIDLRWRIDDATGAGAIHAVSSIWGLLAVGLLVPGSFAERSKHLGVQALGIVVVAVLVLVPMCLLMKVLKGVIGLRSKEADEYDGLDLAEHDLNAYPDFQQTMIKSYHLREA